MDPDKCTEPLTWRDQHPDRRCHVHLLLLNVGTGDVGEQSHEACPGRLVIADVAHICGDPLACIAGGQSLTHHHHLSTGWELLRVGQGFARKGQQRGLLTGQQFFWHLSSPGFTNCLNLALWQISFELDWAPFACMHGNCSRLHQVL